MLYGLPKDHKPVVAGEPLKVRPVAGADEANNQQLSQQCADIITNVTKILDPVKANAICRSTEEMCHAIEEVNKRNDIKDLTVFSMDISGFYPALDINECAKMAAEMWLESDMKLNINKKELGLYLAVTCSRDRLAELGIADVCHVWKSVRGAHPGITTDDFLLPSLVIPAATIQYDDVSSPAP